MVLDSERAKTRNATLVIITLMFFNKKDTYFGPMTVRGKRGNFLFTESSVSPFFAFQIEQFISKSKQAYF